MGIKGIYNEIGPGERIALSKLAVETFERKGRPLRLAIDISIWLFQIQSGRGGTNPALRTFYYRLLRLISLSIHPLFVFDGPNKPPFKRNKRTGPNVASIPEFLAKQLLKQFGLPCHLAPGEAEAECAMLQKAGVVDAVLSEDVDTLMFGSGLILRNWSPEGSLKTKTPTHVNLYDSELVKNGNSRLEPEGMILVALMSGGDYIPEGIPGCGPKTACEAARGGFGRDLCRLSKSDHEGIAHWKERLCHELKTNESKIFKSKHKSLEIPEAFPSMEVLGYYTRPAVSGHEKVEKLRQTLRWDLSIDVEALRYFVADAFDWTYLSGAKKFVRNLAPALLIRELRLRGERTNSKSDDTYNVAMSESRIIKQIFLKRTHPTTGGLTELRVSFTPSNLVKINLDNEEPDPVLQGEEVDSDEEEGQAAVDDENEPSSPKKKRAPSNYDPHHDEKVWVLETFVKIGVPLKVQDWEESFRNARKYEMMKAARRDASKARKKTKTGGMTQGALDTFTKVAKPGVAAGMKPLYGRSTAIPSMDLSQQTSVQSSTASALLTQVAPKADHKVTKRKAGSADVCAQADYSSILPNRGELVISAVDVVDLSRTPVTRSGLVTKHVSQEEIIFSNRNRKVSRSVGISAEPSRDAGGSQQQEKAISQVPLNSTENGRKQRRRSPLRRVNTAPNGTVADDPDISILPNLKQQVLLDSPTSINFSRIASEPSTPTPRRKARKKQIEIVNLLSSPMTPQSRQRSIVDFLSRDSTPNQLVIRQHSAIKTPIDGSSSHTTATRTAQVQDLSPTSKLIPFQLSPSQVMSKCQPTRRSPRNHITPPAPAAWKVHSSKKRVVRLRDSLQGAWTVDEIGSSSFKKPGDTHWRKSGVDVLDLTAS